MPIFYCDGFMVDKLQDARGEDSNRENREEMTAHRIVAKYFCLYIRNVKPVFSVFLDGKKKPT